MSNQDPINLKSFRSEAGRRHSRVAERQMRVTAVLVAFLFVATAAAFLTLRPAGPLQAGNDMTTARGAHITLARG